MGIYLFKPLSTAHAPFFLSSLFAAFAGSQRVRFAIDAAMGEGGYFQVAAGLDNAVPASWDGRLDWKGRSMGMDPSSPSFVHLIATMGLSTGPAVHFRRSLPSSLADFSKGESSSI